MEKLLQELKQELQEIKMLLTLSKQVWTLKEFCAYAGISLHQAYHLTSERKIKFYRPFNKMIYVDKDEVLECLKQNPVDGVKEAQKRINKFLNK